MEGIRTDGVPVPHRAPCDVRSHGQPRPPAFGLLPISPPCPRPGGGGGLATAGVAGGRPGGRRRAAGGAAKGERTPGFCRGIRLANRPIVPNGSMSGPHGTNGLRLGRIFFLWPARGPVRGSQACFQIGISEGWLQFTANVPAFPKGLRPTPALIRRATEEAPFSQPPTPQKNRRCPTCQTAPPRPP